MTIERGAVLGGYRLEEVVGRGGMGVVYRAEQIRLRRHVALKVIAPEYAADPEYRARFERETVLAAALDHPNIVPVIDSGEQDGVLYVTMRLVDGRDLATILAEEGALAPARAAGIVAAVAAALDCAHERGLVHRDVKPANILVRDDHAYLTDFGLAKRFAGESSLTAAGAITGTLDYIAPEQIEGAPGGVASDVYSLGCTLYQTLTGQVPFPDRSPTAKVAAHLVAQAPAPSERAAVPPAFDPVVARAMAKRPEERYASAGELGRAALAAVREPAPKTVLSPAALSPAAPPQAAAAPPPAAPAAPSPPAAPRRRRRLGPIAVVVGLIAAAAIGGFLLFSGSGGDSGSKAPVADTAPGTYSAPTYTAEYPRGWRVVADYEREGTTRRTAFQSPDGVAGVSIDRTAGAGGRPADFAAAVERNLRRTVPGYSPIGAQTITLAGRPTRELRFASDGSTAPPHGVALLFVDAGARYVVTSTGDDIPDVLGDGHDVAGSIEATG